MAGKFWTLGFGQGALDGPPTERSSAERVSLRRLVLTGKSIEGKVTVRAELADVQILKPPARLLFLRAFVVACFGRLELWEVCPPELNIISTTTDCRWQF